VAHADAGNGPVANTQFTELLALPERPGLAQHGQAQTQQAQNRQVVHGYGVYSTQSRCGTWLFAPNGNAGANS
jgi:hypothetical protein